MKEQLVTSKSCLFEPPERLYILAGLGFLKGPITHVHNMINSLKNFLKNVNCSSH